MSYLKSAISAGKMFAKAEADNPIKGFQGLVGLTITLLSGFCIPILGILRRNFGERFLTSERLIWALAVQWLFFWILKGIGFLWGIFNVDGLYRFFVIIDLIVLFHVLRILYQMITEKPVYSYSTGKSWPIWNIFKRISWVSNYTIRLWIEPIFLFFTSLIVMRFFNGAVGSYIFISSFALLQLESTIFRQRRSYYLDMTDSRNIQLGQKPKTQRLTKPVPIAKNNNLNS